MNSTQLEDDSLPQPQESQDASPSRSTAKTDSHPEMRFLPDIPSFRIQRWVSSSKPHRRDSEDSRPKRINADVDWAVEEFERELTLRFVMGEMSLDLDSGVLFLPTDVSAPTPTAASAPPPAPIAAQGEFLKRSFSLRRRWLRNCASSATLHASASKADSDYEASSSSDREGEEGEEEHFDNARPSRPSTPTPSHPLTHHSPRSSHLQVEGEVEKSTSSSNAGDSTHEADINADGEVITPGLTVSTTNSDSLSGESSASPYSPMSPLSRNLHSPEASAASGSDVVLVEGDGSDKPKFTRLQDQRKRLVRRVFRGSFSSVTAPAMTIEASTTTATVTAPAQTAGQTQDSPVSLVSRFSSCTSLGDASSCSSSLFNDQGKKQRAPSILRRFRRFTLHDQREPSHTAVAPPPVALSPPSNALSSSLSFPRDRRFRKRTHSSPAETTISRFELLRGSVQPDLPLPRANNDTIPPGTPPSVPLHPPPPLSVHQRPYPRLRVLTQHHPSKTNHVLSLRHPGTGAQILLPLTILTPPSLPHRSPTQSPTSPRAPHRSFSPTSSSPRRALLPPLKLKKKRLVIRGIEEGDWRALVGLGKWASGLGVVKRMWVVREAESGVWEGGVQRRPRGVTVWIEFRDREVTDNVCRLSARVEIPLVGEVVIDWAEGREAG